MTKETGDKSLPRDHLRSDVNGVTMYCRTCGATFLRREALTPKKGQVACPVCREFDITTEVPEGVR